MIFGPMLFAVGFLVGGGCVVLILRDSCKPKNLSRHDLVGIDGVFFRAMVALSDDDRKLLLKARAYLFDALEAKQ